MAIKFVTDRVSVGKSKSFADLVNEKMNKVAAANEAVVKTAESDEDEEVDEDETEVEAEDVKEAVADEEVKEDTEDTDNAPEKKEACDEAESSGQLKNEPLCQKGESEKPSAVTDKNKKTEAKTVSFVKIAKLNDKTKAMLKTYWSNLYPAEYVDAMLTDQ